MRNRRLLPLLPFASLAATFLVRSAFHLDQSLAQENAADNGRNIARRFDAGQKWAIVIGAEGYIAVGQLDYCCDDARLLANTLAKHGGYAQENILLITDERTEAHLKPIRFNLQRQIPAWL